jgi:hypothetical protein
MEQASNILSNALLSGMVKIKQTKILLIKK